jgi:hypothetical protein
MLDPSSTPSANCIVANFLSTDMTWRKSPRFAGLLQRSSAPSRPRSASHARSLSGLSLDLWTTGFWYGISILLKLQGFLAARKPYFSNFSRAREKTSAPTATLICVAFFCGRNTDLNDRRSQSPELLPHRPSRCHVVQQHDGLTPFHSITSSARARTVGGTSRPSVLAVLRLMTSSNLVGCSIGRSDGGLPLMMRST